MKWDQSRDMLQLWKTVILPEIVEVRGETQFQRQVGPVSVNQQVNLPFAGDIVECTELSLGNSHNVGMIEQMDSNIDRIGGTGKTGHTTLR